MIFSQTRHGISVNASEGAKDAAWIRQLFKELGLDITRPSLYTDNEAADKLARSHQYHHRKVALLVNNGNLTVYGKKQLADPPTKLVPMSTITIWKSTIGIVGTKSLET